MSSVANQRVSSVANQRLSSFVSMKPNVVSRHVIYINHPVLAFRLWSSSKVCKIRGASEAIP